MVAPLARRNVLDPLWLATAYSGGGTRLISFAFSERGVGDRAWLAGFRTLRSYRSYDRCPCKAMRAVAQKWWHCIKTSRPNRACSYYE
jgi:hypothetical protein